MTTTINLDKLLPSFGSEILDALYSDCKIVEGSYDDFLKLPTNENYKPSEELKVVINLKTEDKLPELNLGIKPELLSDELQFPIDDEDLYEKSNIPSNR